MNKRAGRILEYHKIIDMLVGQAAAEMTKEEASKLEPSSDINRVLEELAETEEAVKLIELKGSLPMGNFYDIGGQINLAEKGGRLSIKQLRELAYNMTVAIGIRTFMKGDLPDLPTIESLTGLLSVFPELAERIDKSFLSDSEVADDASPNLRRIRKQMLRIEDDIKNRLQTIVNKNRDFLQDSIVTMRADRYVIPVKQEYKQVVPGIVHDQSATGATIFIEPQVIVEMNNRRKSLEADEQLEIDRILFDLSGQVALAADRLLNNQKILVHLDFMMAKGRLAGLMQAEKVLPAQDGSVKLYEARHPLLDSKTVVPINVELGSGQTLVVTGPNTGGKTVTLKTVGLLAMMMQSGLFLPAASRSSLPIYEEILADIGDEQSIEQSLSTFSSHMKNIVKIVDESGPGSLVLLDELGAGTDPTEGAALAIAILETLRRRGVQVMATTHYTELEKYAVQTENVENASMAFDVESLSPTYKLVMGTPGKSNAFEIASKLGLQDELVDKARDLLNGEEIAFETILEAIEDNKRQAESERQQALELHMSTRKAREEADKEIEKLKKEAERELRRARQEAREILGEAREISEELSDDLKEMQRTGSYKEQAHLLGDARRRIREGEDKFSEKIQVADKGKPASAEDIKEGVRVKIMTLGQNGLALGSPDSKNLVEVQLGSMKMKCKVKDLQLIDQGSVDRSAGKSRAGRSSSSGGWRQAVAEGKKPSAGGVSLHVKSAKNISTSMDVRGENADEAVYQVQQYIDQAFVAGLPSVTIIHGKGEGILKEEISKSLKKNKQVKSFRSGNPSEGGGGVTVVTIQK